MITSSTYLSVVIVFVVYVLTQMVHLLLKDILVAINFSVMDLFLESFLHVLFYV